MFCSRENGVCVCIVLVHCGPFPQEINVKSAKLAIWTVSFNCLHDFTMFAIDIYIRLCSFHFFRHHLITFISMGLPDKFLSLCWHLVLWLLTLGSVFRDFRMRQAVSSGIASIHWWGCEPCSGQWLAREDPSGGIASHGIWPKADRSEHCRNPSCISCLGSW